MTIKDIRESNSFCELRENIAQYLEEREDEYIKIGDWDITQDPVNEIKTVIRKNEDDVVTDLENLKEDDAPLLELPVVKRLKIKIIDEIIPISEKQFRYMNCCECMAYDRLTNECGKRDMAEAVMVCELFNRALKRLIKEGYIK
jgi:hypothetical protein